MVLVFIFVWILFSVFVKFLNKIKQIKKKKIYWIGLPDIVW